jgi:hypothetical protein
MLHLAAKSAARLDSEWKAIYQRLEQRMCPYNAQLKRRVDKSKVINRLATQMATMIYALLKTDVELLDSLEDGMALPPPTLYDRAVYSAARQGCYKSLTRRNETQP